MTLAFIAIVEGDILSVFFGIFVVQFSLVSLKCM